MKIRDRIKSFRRVAASELLPNPKNWRTHPQAQQDAMRALLAEIGFAGAALARQTPEGLMLLDGHLRADLAPDAKIPVLVLDVTDEEADKILATFDPVGAMAEADSESLAGLLREVGTENDALRQMLDKLAVETQLDSLSADSDSSDDAGDEADVDNLPAEKWGVYVDCRDEAQQGELLERLAAEGYSCRGLTV